MKSQSIIIRPNILLRLEAVAIFTAACVVYWIRPEHHWLLFVCAFLGPDLSLLGFLRGPNCVASSFYNLAHTYVFPILLYLLMMHPGRAFWIEATLAWIMHISLDRLLGFGLKYEHSFKYTHIQNAAFPATGI